MFLASRLAVLPSLLGGLIYMFSGNFFRYSMLINHLEDFMLFPLTLYVLERAVKKSSGVLYAFCACCGP